MLNAPRQYSVRWKVDGGRWTELPAPTKAKPFKALDPGGGGRIAPEASSRNGPLVFSRGQLVALVALLDPALGLFWQMVSSAKISWLVRTVSIHMQTRLGINPLAVWA